MPGWYSLGSSTNCGPCPSGTFSYVNGSSECLVCSAGFVSLLGSNFCQKVMHPAIVFKLHGSVDSFVETSDRRAKFVSLLIEKLSLSSSFEPLIVSVRPGSVIVDLVFYHHHTSSLSINDVMLRLRVSFRSGDFESIGVIGLTIGDETISLPDSAIFSLMAIIAVSAMCFLIFCMFGMLFVKKRLDANKIHPFVGNKSSPSLDVNVQSSAASTVTVISSAPAPSPSKFPQLPTSTRASLQESSPGAVFRRVLPRYEPVPATASPFKKSANISGPPASR